MAPEHVLEPQNLSESTKIHIFRSKIPQNPPKNAIFETSDKCVSTTKDAIVVSLRILVQSADFGLAETSEGFAGVLKCF